MLADRDIKEAFGPVMINVTQHAQLIEHCDKFLPGPGQQAPLLEQGLRSFLEDLKKFESIVTESQSYKANIENALKGAFNLEMLINCESRLPEMMKEIEKYKYIRNLSLVDIYNLYKLYF